MGALFIGQGLPRLLQRAQEILEILGFAEVPIHAGEANISDLVHLLKGVHHQLADLLAWNFSFPGSLELADDTIDDALDALILDRALAQSDGDGAVELLAVEGNAAAIGLHDIQFAKLYTLDGGEALAAAGAEAAAADGGRVLRRTGVFHLGVVVATKGAAHAGQVAR